MTLGTRLPAKRKAGGVDATAALLLLGAAALALAALATAGLGGVHLQAGPLRVSISSPLRPAAQALALLLLRQARGACASRGSRLGFLGLLVALLATVAAGSRARLVGDGHEYVAMAWNMSVGGLPALTREQIRAVGAALPEGTDVNSLPWPEAGADGRHDFCHSWAYPALAAPFVRLAKLVGLPALHAFTVLNGLLLVAAAALLLPRAGPRATLLLVGGPLLWWLDKAHAEVFVVALLLAAVAALPTRPGLSLALVGPLGLQYPVFAAPALAAVVWLARRGRLPERGVRAGLVVMALFLAAGVAYNLWRFGQLTPLARTVRLHWPGLAEATAVVIDPNLGLVFAWPALALAGVLGLIRTLGARCLRADTAVLAAVTGVHLLFVVAMTANANHGGTRDMSRYGLWLVPLCVPLLRVLDAAGPLARRGLLLLAAWSVASGLGDHHPARASRYLEPTPLADWLWRRWPAATNPLPEVFAERTSGSEGRDLLPAATEGCEKALVVGDGSPLSVWPLRCPPAELPPPCRAADVYCYANRREGGYSFARAPRQPAYEGIRPAAWYWSGAPSPPLLRVVTAAARDAAREAGPRGIERLLVSARGLGRVRARVGGETVLLWIDRPRRRAGIVLGPDARRRVLLVDPRKARLIASHALDSAFATRIALPRVSPLLLVVLPVSRIPPGLDEALPDSPAASAPPSADIIIYECLAGRVSRTPGPGRRGPASPRPAPTEPPPRIQSEAVPFMLHRRARGVVARSVREQ